MFIWFLLGKCHSVLQLFAKYLWLLQQKIKAHSRIRAAGQQRVC